MARSIWTGVISFGLVSVPVGLYSATREHEVSFHQFQKGTGDRIRYQRVNERTGKQVEFANIVRGAEVGGGRYVLLDSDELDAVAPGRSRSLDIHAFVDLDDIDPVYFQKTYYLAPAGAAAAKPYALLRDAMAEENRAAIGTLVMRGKEYLVAVRADDRLLILETMFFADEVRDPGKELDQLPGRMKLTPAELRMAGQLIESMTGPWNPADYRDTYTDRVNDLIDAKKRGREITVAAEAPEPTAATDLMEVLRRSVEDAQDRRTRPGRGRAAPSAKPAPRSTKAADKPKPAARPKPAATSPAKKSAKAKATPAKKAAPRKATATKAPRKRAA